MLPTEARSNLAADREEVRAKTEQKIELGLHEFVKACRERVKWIMLQDMCALLGVRFDGGAECCFGNRPQLNMHCNPGSKSLRVCKLAGDLSKGRGVTA